MSVDVKPRAKKPRDQIADFKLWVVARGAELLQPTNIYELVRFRADGVTSVIYRNDRNEKHTFTGAASTAWSAFIRRETNFRLTAVEPKPTLSRAERDVIIRTIIERDGPRCFYCDAPLAAGPNRTREHLVARTHGGPEHISNQFIACRSCNAEADHLSAPEKIRLRDRKRRGRGSVLLAQALAVVECNEMPTHQLADAIKSFLNQRSK